MTTDLKQIFSELQFDEDSHTYKIDGEIYPSVSSLIKEFYYPFNPEIAEYVAKKWKVSKQEVLNVWNVHKILGLSRGSRLHDFAEGYAYNNTLSAKDWRQAGAVQWWLDKPDHWTSVEFELRMFSRKFGYAGTLDCLFYDEKEKHYIIMDYKTNKDIYLNYREKTMKPPFMYTLDSPYNHYQLQLSFYQILIEEAGINVGKRYIVWTKRNNHSLYRQIECFDLTEQLRKWLQSDKQ